MRRDLVAERVEYTLMIPYRTESVHFFVLMNSAAKEMLGVTECFMRW